MPWRSTPSFVDDDGQVVLCPTPLSFSVSQRVTTIIPELWRTMSAHQSAQGSYSGPYNNHNDASVPIYDFFNGGVASSSSSDVGWVPPVDPPPPMDPTPPPPPSYPWNNPAEYGVPDHGFGIPMAPPTFGRVPPTDHPLSYAWETPMPHMAPGHGFGIPPMASPTAGGVPRGVSSMGHPSIYSWSNAAEYGVPDGGFGAPHFGYGIPDSGLGVHGTPPTVRRAHDFGKQPAPAPAEQVAKQQEPKESKAATSSYGGKKRDVAKLLEGFTVIEEVRRGGKSIGHKDKYYIHMETGKKLRSLEEVERFKLTGSAKKPKPSGNANASNIGDMGQSSQQSEL